VIWRHVHSLDGHPETTVEVGRSFSLARSLAQWWFVREFGRIGSPGRVMQTPYPSLDEAASALTKLWQAKNRKGYASPA